MLISRFRRWTSCYLAKYPHDLPHNGITNIQAHFSNGLHACFVFISTFGFSERAQRCDCKIEAQYTLPQSASERNLHQKKSTSLLLTGLLYPRFTLKRNFLQTKVRFPIHTSIISIGKKSPSKEKGASCLRTENEPTQKISTFSPSPKVLLGGKSVLSNRTRQTPKL
jgi:hypothetical protein